MPGMNPSHQNQDPTLALFNQLSSGICWDAATQTAVFSDIHSAIVFRRRFPHWEVRCLLILPRLAPGKNPANNYPQTVPAIRHSPTLPAAFQTPCQGINLCHPLHNVAATADILGLWRENGRFIGLELCFPDGHHTHLTFQEIAELQAS